jgi:hypothetical protein
MEHESADFIGFLAPGAKVFAPIRCINKGLFYFGAPRASKRVSAVSRARKMLFHRYLQVS